MRLRFIIRDLLWLALMVALGTGWWLDHRHLMELIHQDDDFNLSGPREVNVPIIQFSSPAK